MRLLSYSFPLIFIRSAYVRFTHRWTTKQFLLGIISDIIYYTKWYFICCNYFWCAHGFVDSQVNSIGSIGKSSGNSLTMTLFPIHIYFFVHLFIQLIWHSALAFRFHTNAFDDDNDAVSAYLCCSFFLFFSTVSIVRHAAIECLSNMLDWKSMTITKTNFPKLIHNKIAELNLCVISHSFSLQIERIITCKCVPCEKRERERQTHTHIHYGCIHLCNRRIDIRGGTF